MPGGQPTKYRALFATQAKKLCELGATDAELADFFEVTISTVRLWMVTHPKFSDSVNSGKDSWDDRIERSLAQRAKGYSHDEDDIRTMKVLEIVDGQPVVFDKIVITPTRKHYPPETTAAIFWLCNRRREKWKRNLEQGPETNEDLAAALKTLAEKLPV